LWRLDLLAVGIWPAGNDAGNFYHRCFVGAVILSGYSLAEKSAEEDHLTTARHRSDCRTPENS